MHIYRNFDDTFDDKFVRDFVRDCFDKLYPKSSDNFEHNQRNFKSPINNDSLRSRMRDLSEAIQEYMDMTDKEERNEEHCSHNCERCNNCNNDKSSLKDSTPYVRVAIVNDDEKDNDMEDNNEVERSPDVKDEYPRTPNVHRDMRLFNDSNRKKSAPQTLLDFDNPKVREALKKQLENRKKEIEEEPKEVPLSKIDTEKRVQINLSEEEFNALRVLFKSDILKELVSSNPFKNN